VRTVEAWFPAEAAERALADCDVLFSCVDNDAARRSLQLFALALNLPLFDLAAGIGPPGGSGDPLPEAGGQLRIFLPGGPCLGCMGLRPDGEGFPRGGRTGGCLADGAGPSSGVVTLNGIMALLGLGKMVEWLCGAGLEARHLKYRSRPATIYQVRETRRAGCPLCGNPLPGGT
jgi:molybdopterin/thiamine biosynthesis adenylyltransferase